MKKRIKKKFEYKSFDEDEFYRQNANGMMDIHKGGIEFWTQVRKYAKKERLKKIADRLLDYHRNYHQKANNANLVVEEDLLKG